MPVDFDAKPLHGRVAWVTGASRGIGRATAHALARAGAAVALGARSLEQLDGEVAVLTGAGCTAAAWPLDVSVVESCESFAAAAVERLGPPDILVNNAGVGKFRPVDAFLPDEFEHQFRVNVFGTFHMTRLAIPYMKQLGGGHIVNVSSLAGESAARMGCGYFASKAAVNAFTRCLLEDVREDEIRVTLVCPGSTDTRFNRDSHPGMHERDQSWMLRPEDVARTIVQVLAMPPDAVVSKVDVRPLRTTKAKP